MLDTGNTVAPARALKKGTFSFKGILFEASGAGVNFAETFAAPCDAPGVSTVNHLFLELDILNRSTKCFFVYDKVDIEPLAKLISAHFAAVVKVSSDEYNGRERYLAQYAGGQLLGTKTQMPDHWSCMPEQDIWKYRY